MTAGEDDRLTPARLAEIGGRVKAIKPGVWLARAKDDLLDHASSDIPALLSAIRALEAENARLREALDAAAGALEITADFLASEPGYGGTVLGIRYDAKQARAALQPAKEPK